MLLSSLILIIIAAVTNKIILLLLILFYGILITCIRRNNFKRNIAVSGKIFLFTVFTAMFQLFFINTGKVLFSFWSIIITNEGVYSVGLTSLKILCIMVLSWTIKYEKINLKKLNYRYAIICKTSVKILPEVLPLIKQKFSFGFILRKVYRLVLKELDHKKEIEGSCDERRRDGPP